MKEDVEETPDILEASSHIILAIIRDYSDRAIPDYVRPLTLDDYFSEKVTGSQAIKTIQRAWETNKKDFDIDKRHGQLRYNAAQTWEADRIIKELPEDLEAYKSREYIVMDLDKAEKFFAIDFRKQSGIWNIFGR